MNETGRQILDAVIQLGLELIVRKLGGARDRESVEEADDIARTLLSATNGSLSSDYARELLQQFAQRQTERDAAALRAIEEQEKAGK